MSRHDTVVIKETHRGLLYEDGILREVLPAGRYLIPRPPSGLSAFFGAKGPRVEVALVDVRGRDRTVVVQDVLTADNATISASFAVQYRVVDPRAALHEVKNFEERLYCEAQTAARRVLRGMSFEEVMASRDEIGEELLRQLAGSAGSYGLAVSGLDFKDLVLPDDLRRAMDRAACARRLRLARVAEGRPDDDAETETEAESADVDADEAEVISARMAFDRPAGSRDDGPALRPHGLEARSGTQGGGLDLGLRRFRP